MLKLSTSALAAILEKSWPGRQAVVDEALGTACALSRSGVVDRADIESILDSFPERTEDTTSLPRRDGKPTIEDVRAALASTDGNKVQAAKELGIGRATLYRFLKKYPEAEE